MTQELKDRVIKFKCMELPGQPMMMHMGTSYLVNDLWSAIERLTAENSALAEEIEDFTKENVVLTAERDALAESDKRLREEVGNLEEGLDGWHSRYLDCEADIANLGDDLAQAERYIETLTDERDAYQVAADKMAGEHKIERDALSVQIDELAKDAARMQGDMLLPANALGNRRAAFGASVLTDGLEG